MDSQIAIEDINPAMLLPHPQNSRVHSNAQIEQLMASIEQFGFNGVILIDENNVILAGHGRTQAMIRLGRETIPCQRKIGLSDAEKRAYVIVDNQVALNSEWDAGILAAEVSELLESGFDLANFGIPTAALAALESAPPSTASEIQEIETRTDKEPPSSDENFRKEMARTDTAGLLPIVPLYAEHHEAFIILCDNAIDEAWLRNLLGLEQLAQSYKDIKALRPNVLTAQQLRERLQ